MKPAVFLDRDGVLNRAVVRDGKPYPPAGLEAFELLPGVEDAAAALRAAGYLLVVVTNQPDVATGKQRREVVEAMHERLRAAGLCDDIRACYHTDADDCDCRKPKPGMFEDIAHRFNLDLAGVPSVGDSLRDLQAAAAVGAQPILVLTGKGKQTKAAGGLPAQTQIYADLAAAVKSIVS